MEIKNNDLQIKLTEGKQEQLLNANTSKAATLNYKPNYWYAPSGKNLKTFDKFIIKINLRDMGTLATIGEGVENVIDTFEITPSNISSIIYKNLTSDVLTNEETKAAIYKYKLEIALSTEPNGSLNTFGIGLNSIQKISTVFNENGDITGKIEIDEDGKMVDFITYKSTATSMTPYFTIESVTGIYY